ncbi:MAG: GpE family phage tail protein [Shewanella sp.]|nr:GpE family phage tail protein [Shewanella sp.]
MEADLFLVFTGWDASTTQSMMLPELMRWHGIAIKRHEKAMEATQAG